MRGNAIVYDYDLRGRKTYEGGILGDRPHDCASNLQILDCSRKIIQYFKTDTLGTDPHFRGQEPGVRGQ